MIPTTKKENAMLSRIKKFIAGKPEHTTQFITQTITQLTTGHEYYGKIYLEAQLKALDAIKQTGCLKSEITTQTIDGADVCVTVYKTSAELLKEKPLTGGRLINAG